ncbi:MAG TPA: class I SAM-dependent methyltransferase [Firmicutes bacterium]|nr:class I SAM-dependent methyltransferase [Bacillota bacterium]
MSKTATKQKKIYDGKEAGYVPVYSDKKLWNNVIDSYIARAKNKILGTSLKAVRNIKEIEKMGLKKGEKVLDAGCGGGILINQLRAAYGIKGYGVDISSLAIKRAKDSGYKDIKYHNAGIETLPFKAGTFDAIVSFDVLEHIENKEKALKELLRVLKPGGRMLLYAISKKDIFTWHWFLRMVTFGRAGNDTEGGHFREFFAEPRDIKKTVLKYRAEECRVSYFHSFFTLLIDEVLFKMVNKRKKNTGRRPAAGISDSKKGFVYKILYYTHPVFELLDIPWKTAGLSNGFFVKIKK